MKTPPPVRTIVGATVILLGAVTGSGTEGLSGRLEAQVSAPTLEDYHRWSPDELPARYRDWLENEVRWIITDLEREVFLRLESDADRERFVEEFWRQRDPTPGTPRNEYRDLHQERLAYADRFFGRETPLRGSLTDRGQIHILLGEPQTRSRMDTSSIVHPTEVWFYGVDRRLGVPPFFYVVFFQKDGVGAYQTYSPVADGPTALLNASGEDLVRQLVERGGDFGAPGYDDPAHRAAKQAFRREAADLVQAAFTLLPGENSDRPSLRSEILLVDIYGLPGRIMPRPEWAYTVLTGSVDAEVRFDALSLEAQAVGLVAEDGSSFIAYHVGTASQGLNWTSYEQDAFLTFAVTNVLRRGNTVLEQAPTRFIESRMEQEAARRSRREDLFFVDRIPAIPGELSLEVVFENNVTRAFGVATLEVDVPEPNPTELAIGAPILAVEARDQPYDAYSPQFPFQVGPTAVLPAVNAEFARESELVVFHQLYLPAARRDPVLVSYRLFDDTGSVRSLKQVSVRPEQADRLGVANLVTRIPLSGLETGAYRLETGLATEPGDQARAFRIVAERPDPILHAERRPAPADALTRLRLAGQYRAANRLDRAEMLLDHVLGRLPDSEEALALQVDVLRAMGKHDRLVALLEQRLTGQPNDARLLVQVAEAASRVGRHHDAVRYYERARLAGLTGPRVLNALAAEYSEVGDEARARELLRLSLEADPSQPRIRALLERDPGSPRQRR